VRQKQVICWPNLLPDVEEEGFVFNDKNRSSNSVSDFVVTSIWEESTKGRSG